MKDGVAVPVFQGHFLLSLPRPDRWYRRLRTRKLQSNLTADLVRGVLDRYGLRLQRPATLIAGPSRSTNVVVETDAGTKILKRYRNTVEQVAIVHEHSILNYLASISFPVPHLTSTGDGETLVEIGGRWYALFEYLEGYFQYHNSVFFPPQTRQFVTSAGQALACFHLALRDFVPAGYNPNGFKPLGGERWRELTWYRERLDWCRSEARRGGSTDGQPLSRVLSERADWIADSLSSLDDHLKAADPRRLIIHGDYGPYNLLFKKDASVVVVDLELARLDWRLTDLATGLEKFAKNRGGLDFGKMRCFLESYNGTFPMHRDELRLLPAVWRFWVLRRVVIWWHRYCQDGEVHWLVKARRALNLVRWLAANEGALASLYEVC